MTLTKGTEQNPPFFSECLSIWPIQRTLIKTQNSEALEHFGKRRELVAKVTSVAGNLHFAEYMGRK